MLAVDRRAVPAGRGTVSEPTEVDYARVVVAHLKERGWTTYEEVSIGYGGRRADIVAEQDGRLWVIEVKTTMSLDLLGQAFAWNGFAHWVSVAVPAYRRIWKRGQGTAEHYCRLNGIGVLRVSLGEKGSSWDVPKVEEEARPTLFRRAVIHWLRDRLNEGNRNGKAGSAGNCEGQYWTPFKETVDQLHRIVKAQPGLRMKEAIAQITHHYSTPTSARGTITRYIRTGVIKGLSIENGKLYPSPPVARSEG